MVSEVAKLYAETGANARMFRCVSPAVAGLSA